jgi:Xaa-Pro aminopeptidase
MRSAGLAAYVVPTQDAHSSEYVAECDKRRAFLSGFTGSAGTALVTHNAALLWTDGRYFLQAQQQLEPCWTLMKQGIDVQMHDYLNAHLSSNDSLGFDPLLMPLSQYKEMDAALACKLAPVSQNLVDLIWRDRPSRPKNTVILHDHQFCGVDAASKVQSLMQSYETMASKPCLIVTALDEVAWLLNLRGSDIEFNPVFFSYAAVSSQKVVLWCDAISQFMADELKTQLAAKNVEFELRPYEAAVTELASVFPDCHYFVSSNCNLAASRALPQDRVTVESVTVICRRKAVKNESELSGMRAAHRRDGAALACLFYDLCAKRVWEESKQTEFDVANLAEQYRSKLARFKGLSFDSIVGTGPNAAIIHYKPERDTALPIQSHILLVDSGAQFLDGTTDVTRTVWLGRAGEAPPANIQRAYTRVLQGHISLARAVFPQGTNGYMLDILARQHLWRDGLDYRHGTGHGVGCFLHVHEGPHGISFRDSARTISIEPGMVVSNEPGYYEDGSFGIRIENLIECVPVIKNGFGGKPYYGFSNLTMFPYARELIARDLLSPEEIAYIDAYHAQCEEAVLPELDAVAASDDVKEWFRQLCRPLVAVSV